MDWEHTVGEEVRTAVRAAGIDAAPEVTEVTGSTNADLVALAADGAPEWTVAVTGRQDAGRGRMGRVWVSPEGASLMCSVLLRPAIDAEWAPLLSLAAAVAMADACETASGLRVRCKWPNDLVVLGRKLGGVLAEARIQAGALEYVVIGTGINVGQDLNDFPEELRATATSVLLEGGRPDVPGLLHEYLVRLRELYGDRGQDLHERLWPRYLEISDTFGRLVRATTITGDVVLGHAVGMGEAGELLLSHPVTRQLVAVAFGEIEHVR